MSVKNNSGFTAVELAHISLVNDTEWLETLKLSFLQKFLGTLTAKITPFEES